MDELLEALVSAIAEEDYGSAGVAVSLGADVNAALDQFGHTPLSCAAYKGGATDEVVARRVRWLLDAGARVAGECRTAGEETSVHVAAAGGCTDALKLLLDADGCCALEMFDELSRTPLIRAVCEGQLPAAMLLIQAGSNVNARDEANIGDPALSWAVVAKNEEMVKLLLAAGADPTLTGWMQLSALDRAEEWRESRQPALRRIYELLEHAVARAGARPRRS